ncbi:MAG: phospholipid carrier-dependent glycosyltransferase [Actinomycetota bacterium]|nr:phospholipid carrier-dependent glycosyltransferase [Actinomycetota bacterium]
MTPRRQTHVEEVGDGTWSPVDFAAGLVVVMVGFVMRLVNVAVPAGRIFDESYYAPDACLYAQSPASLCGSAAEITTVHPPLGKWLIAAGVRGFGYNSLGWRMGAVVAGTATIALLYLLARELLRSTVGASFAAGLLAIDPLHFVQSRVAMLDIFVPLFGLAAFYFLLLDRRRLLRPQPDAGPPLFDRPWRMVAGAAAGAATASKWSGALVAVGLIGLTVAWEVAARRADGGPRPARRALAQEGASIFVWLILTPVIVYAFSYAGVLDGSWRAAPWSEGSWMRVFVERQIYMVNFHIGLDKIHSYQSPAWSWILIKRPVSFYFTHAANGDYREIAAIGNPVMWWTSLLALLYVGVNWVRRHSLGRPEGFILAGFLLTYGPWLVIASGRSAVFLFYLLPTVPFMCLGISYVMTDSVRSVAGRAAVILFGTACILTFAFYYPLLAARPLPYEQWHRRIWVFDNCDKPAPKESSDAAEDQPPQGWCWI